jgi:hypothetical protein
VAAETSHTFNLTGSGERHEMKIRELIQLLQEYDPVAPVVVRRADGGGLEDAEMVELVTMVPNCDEARPGYPVAKYSEVLNPPAREEDEARIIEAVLLHYKGEGFPDDLQESD